MFFFVDFRTSLSSLASKARYYRVCVSLLSFFVFLNIFSDYPDKEYVFSTFKSVHQDFFREEAPNSVSLEFLGEQIFPSNYLFQGGRVGGLSGLTKSPSPKKFYAVTDDCGLDRGSSDERNAARIYVLAFVEPTSHNGSSPFAIKVEEVIYLTQPAAATNCAPLDSVVPASIVKSKKKTVPIQVGFDPEGISFVPPSSQMPEGGYLVTSEQHLYSVPWDVRINPVKANELHANWHSVDSWGLDVVGDTVHKQGEPTYWTVFKREGNEFVEHHSYPIPLKYRAAPFSQYATAGIRLNAGFESVTTLETNGSRAIMAFMNEEPLQQDDEAFDKRTVRLLVVEINEEVHSLSIKGEFPFRLENMSPFYTNNAIDISSGVSCIAWTGDSFLVLERAYFLYEKANTEGRKKRDRLVCRIYQVHVQKNVTDITQVSSLSGANYVPLSKKLVLDLTKVSTPNGPRGFNANFEAMLILNTEYGCLLIIVNDNNFEVGVSTHFLFFKINGVSCS